MSRPRRTPLDPRRLQELERWYRQVGYQDGYGGKSPGSMNPHYKTGYRRGKEARARGAEG